MRGFCALCSEMIVTPDDLVLDAGRSEREFRVFLLGVIVHVQRSHPDVAPTLNPLFLDLQLLFYSFFLDPLFESPWQAKRLALHEKFRELLNKEMPIEIKKVQPAAGIPERP